MYCCTMKKNLVLVLAFACFGFQLFAQNLSANDVVGTYLNAEKTAHVKIFLGTDGKFHGKVVWMKEPNESNGNAKLDIHNPNLKLRDKPRLGLQIMRNFSFNTKDQMWEGGTVYDPNNGKTYDGYMKFMDGDKSTLYLRGYVMGMSWLGRTAAWKRIE